MSEVLPTGKQEDISHRELSSIEVTETNPKEGSLLVRAHEDEALELIRRLLDEHYGAKPERAVAWYREFDALIRQMARERETDQWGTDHAVFLFDVGSVEDSVTRDPAWVIEIHAGPNGLCIVTFRRSQPGRTVTFSGGLYPPNVGKKYIDNMQSKVLNAMQAR